MKTPREFISLYDIKLEASGKLRTYLWRLQDEMLAAEVMNEKMETSAFRNTRNENSNDLI